MRDYRPAPYLAVVERLQQWGPDLAVPVLQRAATQGLNEPLILLCRLLFRGRGAASGAPVLLGDTTPDDWPMEPLHLQDGVPFLIATGYDLGGRAETAAKYLNYCVNHASWSRLRFSVASPVEMERAFRALLADGRWKRPLLSEEVGFLARQVGPTAAARGLVGYSRNWPERGELWPEWWAPAEPRVVREEPPAFPQSFRERFLWRTWTRPAFGGSQCFKRHPAENP